MASYVVMQPPDRTGTADRAVFVRDGFSWIGFLLPPVWLLWRKLWIEALIAFAAALALAALGDMAGLGVVSVFLSLLVSIYVGLEGPALRLAALRRRGWQEAGMVDAPGREDAELRFFAAAAMKAAPEAPRAAPPPPPAFRQTRPGPALGLLDYPGKP